MLRFNVMDNGAPVKSLDVSSAQLVGSDNVPLRGELTFRNGQIICDTRSRGPAALAIMWPIKGIGRVMLETTRLMERDEPYNLHVELARGRLVRISQKREDWGLFDFPDGQPIYDEVDKARDLFVQALTAPDEPSASRLGEMAVQASVTAASRMGVFHAEVFLQRRHASNQLGKRLFGCELAPGAIQDATLKGIAGAFDFVAVPFNWCDIEPEEGAAKWADMEKALKMLRQQRLHIHGSSLISFEKSNLPAWTYLWEGDYDQVQSCIEQHLTQVFKRFAGPVQSWEVVSGIHAHNDFHLSFEQLMDVTRTALTVAKKLAAHSAAMIGLTLPWGEYYGVDQRTIPPLLYADMVVRNGINFDAFVLDVRFGANDKELFLRDPFQISSMLDAFGGLGKPLHLQFQSPWTSNGNAPASDDAVRTWIRAFHRIAFSKPFVETVTWRPASGKATPDALRGPVLDEIRALRTQLLGKPSKFVAKASTRIKRV